MDDDAREDDRARSPGEPTTAEERVQDVAGSVGLLKEAWQATLDDMEDIADEHREAGRTVTAIAAVDAGPLGRDTNDEDGEYGLEFVIPDNRTEEFVEAFEAGDYPSYDVYRAEAETDAFVVEELVDEDAGRVILLAGAFPIRDETMCAFAAREEGEMYSFVRTLDGTRYGAFHHEGYEKFFPRAKDLPDDPADLMTHHH